MAKPTWKCPIGARPCSFAEAVRKLNPTVLLGVTGLFGYFGETDIRHMAAHVERPVICPFSNPTSKAEATPENLMEWSDGRALVATGSPFPPVNYEGRTIHIGQGNNVFVFPGVGLGALVAEAVRVNEAMFLAAGDTLADLVSEQDLALGRLSVNELRHVSRELAIAVVRAARFTGAGKAIADEDIPKAVDALIWGTSLSAIRIRMISPNKIGVGGATRRSCTLVYRQVPIQ